MSEEIDAIMFDAGGTLFDLKPSKEEVFRKVLNEKGFKASLEKVIRTVAEAERKFDGQAAVLDGVNEGPFWKRYDRFVLDRLGFTGDLEEFSKDLTSEFEKLLHKVDSWAEYPDARPLLEDLKDRDFRLGVISNATDLVAKVLDRLDLARFFDPIVISDNVGVRKPNERIFLMAAEMIGARPNRILYIGDKLAIDVLGASRAGLNAVLLDRMNVYANVNCLRIKSLSALRRYL
jgi:putative hydrolase of the HAD superfamily